MYLNSLFKEVENGPLISFQSHVEPHSFADSICQITSSKKLTSVETCDDRSPHQGLFFQLEGQTDTERNHTVGASMDYVQFTYKH